MVAVNSTYRLQLRGDELTLDDARGLVDYLQRLGVTHLYLSPILTATRGSTHGYDVTDPTTVSAELGGTEALQRLADELRSRDMGIVVDIVPNHLGVADARQNRWWWDVLKFGRESRFANYFDIDWSPDNGVGGRIALPVLGSETDPAALKLDRSGDEPTLAFHEMRFPIAPGTDEGNALAVHDRQNYRLVHWKAGLATYRRFFTVNDLAAVRQEDPEVFATTHRAVRTWADNHWIDGIRVDHPDGLARPAEYLRHLGELIGVNRWLVIEKILGAEEPLDATLPVDGTTGYDALAQLGGVFVDPAGQVPLTDLSRRLTGSAGDADWLHDAERAAKKVSAQTGLAPEVRRLVAAIRREAPSPCSVATLSTAVVETIAEIPVYRTDYAPLSGLLPRIVGALERRNPHLAEPLAVLTRALAVRGETAVRFEQICGAVTAKSVEDYLFYRTARLVSLQEVGGDPGRWGHSPNEFHLANTERSKWWPAAMTTLSTHDTKRGEDVRARIGVLSQVGELWAERVREWEQAAPSPEGTTGLFLWQNMFGVWPTDGAIEENTELRERLHAYAEKAMREGGIRTTWNDVDSQFEDDVHAWIDTILSGPVADSMTELVQRLAPHGWTVSLGQKLLQLCGPGVPDIYQGTELWEDSLVDPDNRRPVDFAHRAALLESLASTPRLDHTGTAKLWVVAHALWLRRQRVRCFIGGSYRPVQAFGPAAEHLVGFGRGQRNSEAEVIALATRHSVALEQTGWGETRIDLGVHTWTDRLSGRSYSASARAAELFNDLPVALLVR